MNLNSSRVPPLPPHSSFHFGFAEEANLKRRRRMEDSHAFSYDFCGWQGWGFFGVYDGHGGKAAADWCGANLHRILEKNLKEELCGWTASENILPPSSIDSFNETESTPSPTTSHPPIGSWKKITNILDRTFLECDEQLDPAHGIFSGCTVIVAIIAYDPRSGRRRLFTANVGDSRAVLSRSGKAIRLSFDHQARVPEEKHRIKECGGLVINDRVNGTLAVSRALGDASMKEFVTGHPYTTETEITELDIFLILACDGLWDVCSDQEACEYIAGDTSDPQRCSDLLIAFAMEQGTTDNLSILVVYLQAKQRNDRNGIDFTASETSEGKATQCPSEAGIL